MRGHVTEIGSLKEKLIAAKRGLLDIVLIPDENKKDLVDVPEEIKKSLDINIIKNVKDALGLALVAHPKDIKDQQKNVNDISWTSDSGSQPSA